MNEALILLGVMIIFFVGCMVGGLIDMYTDKKKKERQKQIKAWKKWKKSHKLFVGQIEKII